MEPDAIQAAVDLTRRGILLALELSLPVLLSGMVVGFLISLLQAVTQIQEQTISFVPRLFAAALALFFTLPWVFSVLSDYTRESFQGMRAILWP